MLDEMPASMFVEWMAYAELEPFGEVRADLRIAQLDSLFANANRDRKARPNPYRIQDFMFDFDKEPESAEDKLKRQIATAKILAATTGGAFHKGRGSG